MFSVFFFLHWWSIYKAPLLSLQTDQGHVKNMEVGSFLPDSDNDMLYMAYR